MKTDSGTQWSFDEASHTYRMRGIIIPSVTQILKLSGLYRGADWFTPEGAEFGNYVHKACEYDDNGILDYDDLDPNIKECVDGWRKFKKDTGFTPIGVEVAMVSEIYWYGGKLDVFGTFAGDTRIHIVDRKTGAKQPAADPLQLAAYGQLVMENYHHKQIPPRGCVYLPEGKWQPYEGSNHFEYFISYKNGLAWKEQHGLLTAEEISS